MNIPRRVVTGHDASGRGVVINDGPAAVSRQVADGASFFELWATPASPAPIAASEAEPVAESDPVGPPAGGTRVRIVDMPQARDRRCTAPRASTTGSCWRAR